MNICNEKSRVLFRAERGRLNYPNTLITELMKCKREIASFCPPRSQFIDLGFRVPEVCREVERLVSLINDSLAFSGTRYSELFCHLKS